MNTEHYRKLEKMYLNANINKYLYDTTTIKIDHRRAEISLVISEKYFHALDAIHGSIYFRLLDDSAFFAVNSIVEDAFVLTTSFNMNIVRPANKGIIKAVGEVRFESKNLFTAQSTLYNEEGKEIAFATGNFAKSKIELTEKIGYKL
jgi:uncharacterized protein (TIGR00369 family)